MPGQLSIETIAAAQSAMANWDIPASVTLAQYALESGWGQHVPPNSNNPFGIKAKPGQAFVTVPTREVINGKSMMVQAAFRAYDSLADAFDDHGRLLASAPVYAPAMAAWKASRDVRQFVPLMAQHYATDPHYAGLILSIIDTNHMTQYDAGDVA
jgi:flagellum-specific peptidoglycan hydrolase FlgJ